MMSNHCQNILSPSEDSQNQQVYQTSEPGLDLLIKFHIMDN